jgi:hypothetical protein
MRRFALLSASNTFPRLGDSATLMGCLTDSTENRQEKYGPWKKSGWDFDFDLRESLDTAQNLRDRLTELVAKMNEGTDPAILDFERSSHGTEFIDYITGLTVSCCVNHDSTWDDPKTFFSKLDMKRILDKLNPVHRVFSTFDCCMSGNFGDQFKLLEDFKRVNRGLIAPPDAHRDLKELSAVKLNPKQCWTLAGCEDPGTCADVHDDNPHGLFNRTKNAIFDANPNLPLSKLAALINKNMDGQKCVPNGPEWSWLQEA